MIDGPEHGPTFLFAHGAGAGMETPLMSFFASRLAKSGLDQIAVHWVPDGDHSFVPRKASGRSVEQNWQYAVDAVTAFLHGKLLTT